VGSDPRQAFVVPPGQAFESGKFMTEILWIAVLIAVLLAILVKLVPVKRVVVYEYQKALKYHNGRCVAVLGAGRYWILPFFTSVVPVDIRPEFLTIPSQDVLSADGVSLRVSLAAEFQVSDVSLAINKNANFRADLYLTLQIALREIVGKEKIETLVANRVAIGPKLMETAASKADSFGLKLLNADVKDVMFAGEMKTAFAQVVKAQKEGQAALERARGETAALRSLANAARMMDDNPNLLQLRALQSLADSKGNTLVLGLPGGSLPIAKNPENPDHPNPRTTLRED
jgi:regulator of protease activity HflC (stomatin/prohibitin superfamily)